MKGHDSHFSIFLGDVFSDRLVVDVLSRDLETLGVGHSKGTPVKTAASADTRYVSISRSSILTALSTVLEWDVSLW